MSSRAPIPKPVARSERIKQRSAERRNQQKQELRQTILRAAVRLFEEKGGHEHFSLRQVAEAIGYSATTIYLYFKDKDELLYYVVLEGFREFGHSLQAAYQSQTEPWKRLEAIGWAYFDFALSHRIHYRLMFRKAGEFLHRSRPEGYESFVDSFGVLLQTIKDCIEAGQMTPGDVRAYGGLIWSGLHGIVDLCLAGEFSESDARGLFAMQMGMIQKAYRIS